LAVFTRRQSDYAATLRRPDIYTPQLVIDGRLEAIGSDWSAVRRAFTDAARSAHATITLGARREQAAGEAALRLTVQAVLPSPAKTNVRVMAAVVEDDLATSVLRGENASKTLKHSAVARWLDAVGTVQKGEATAEFARSLKLDPAWRSDRLRIVVFLQEERTRRVLGSAAARIE
jgi:hypothetical protein